MRGGVTKQLSNPKAKRAILEIKLPFLQHAVNVTLKSRHDMEQWTKQQGKYIYCHQSVNLFWAS